DRVHQLLRAVGSRHRDEGRVGDASGQLRLVYRTPNWEDFVELAVTEIRQFGGQSIQVARRLRAMLEHPVQTLAEGRGSVLSRELALLHRSAERFSTEPEDRALAEVSDLQGVGGSQGHARPFIVATSTTAGNKSLASSPSNPERSLRWESPEMAGETANPPAGPV